jgi:hypothetical protein
MSQPGSGPVASPTHTIVLTDAGPNPEGVVNCLRDLGCPDEPAHAFVRAAAAGSKPTIMYDVPPADAARVVAALQARQATVTTIPELANVASAPPPPSWPPPAASPVGPPPFPSAPSGPPPPAPQPSAPLMPPALPPFPTGPLPGPAGTSPVSLPSTPDAIVGRYVDAYNAGDVAEIRRLFAPDAVFDDTNGQVMARGQDAIGDLFDNLIKHVPGRYVSVAGRMCLGPWVVDHQVAHTPGQPDQPTVANYLVTGGLIRRVLLLRE